MHEFPRALHSLLRGSSHSNLHYTKCFICYRVFICLDSSWYSARPRSFPYYIPVKVPIDTSTAIEASLSRWSTTPNDRPVVVVVTVGFINVQRT